MKYDYVTAKTYDEAIMDIKKKYGDRAMIIRRTEHAEGGFLGFGKKRYVKVLVSISDDEYLKKSKEGFAYLQSNLKGSGTPEKTVPAAKPPIDSGVKNSIQGESISLSILMEKLNNLEKVIQYKEFNKGENIHPNLEEIKDILKENEFFDDFINELIEEINKSLPLSKINDKSEVHKFVYEYIKKDLQISGGFKLDNVKKVLVLVGPTGVGKTTTVAKIAANAIRDKINIELITIDGYRLGARFQLEKYAEIMNVKMMNIEDNMELQRVVALSKADMIIVDTTGRSQKDEINILKMKQLLDLRNCALEFVLTISANTKQKEVERIFKSFDIFDYKNVIITKIDESDSIGAIINACIDKKKAIMYYTDGQKVPNDIEKADIFNIISKIKGLETEIFFSLAKY
ncbi:MAG TPA: AAA family ATPase [Spirochaetota bacterium]|nr:AAA family ATPase [Spirochaetota bacterium]HOS33560.1 AAA family ATPase [Spirochaetota bacterium]HOS56554.1 AAA family ATPase [Spirochaetota bacterium]HPK62619.1 AAA family ATPase [Spirochaetota bacterium]HQF78859.1 AAA family ATPase [Spirochaetota bacterium]